MNGKDILTMTLTRIQDLVGYVLVVARGDGQVLVLGSDNAPNRLIAINAASPLEHEVSIYRTDHYQTIVDALRVRFRTYSADGFGIWFQMDPSEIRNAVEEFDLATGQRVRMGLWLKVGGRATVKEFGPGTISSMNERGAVVQLDRPKGNVRQVLAPRVLLKPHLRAISA